eukprot:6517739-Prymnesium_polylepis.1
MGQGFSREDYCVNVNPFGQTKQTLAAELDALKQAVRSRPDGAAVEEVAKLKAELALTQQELKSAVAGTHVATLQAEVNALRDVAKNRPNGAAAAEVAKLKAELTVTMAELGAAKVAAETATAATSGGAEVTGADATLRVGSAVKTFFPKAIGGDDEWYFGTVSEVYPVDKTATV